MKSEEVIRSILKQYKFNLEMDKQYRPQEIEDITRTEQWVRCLQWVLDIEPQSQQDKEHLMTINGTKYVTSPGEEKVLKANVVDVGTKVVLGNESITISKNITMDLMGYNIKSKTIDDKLIFYDSTTNEVVSMWDRVACEERDENEK